MDEGATVESVMFVKNRYVYVDRIHRASIAMKRKERKFDNEK